MSKKCEIKQKPFLTFEEQLAHLLKNRKLNVKKENSNKLLAYLKCYNYQNFINGYNDPFMKGFRRRNNQYIESVTEQSIIELFNYDRWLSKTVLSNIQNFERRFNTAICYYISLKLKSIGCLNGDILSLDIEEYKHIFKTNNIKKLEFIQNLFFQIYDRTRNDLTKKYEDNFKKIPIWSLLIFASFGELITLYNKLNDDIQKQITYHMFNNKIDFITLSKVMTLFKDLRNRCCHNNVVFNFKVSKNEKIIKKFMLEHFNGFSGDVKITNIVLLIDYLSFSFDNKNFHFYNIYHDKTFKKINQNEFIPKECINEICRIMGFKPNFKLTNKINDIE